MSLDLLTKALGLTAGTVSLEDGDVNLEINIDADEDGVPLDTTAAPEAELVEAQVEEAEVIETENAQGDLEEAHESLEGLLISVEQYKAQGGMPANVAQATYNHLDTITRRWGISLRSGLPAMESYGATGSAMSATISLENAIVDAIKKYWKIIIDTVTKWINQLRSWVVKIVATGERLAKRANAMKTKVAEIKGTVKADATINLAQAGGNGVTVAAAAENLALLATHILVDLPTSYEAMQTGVGAGTVAATTALEKGSGSLDTSGIKAVYKALTDGETDGTAPSPYAGVSYIKSKPLPGYKAFGVTKVDALGNTALSNDLEQGLSAAKANVNLLHADFIAAGKADPKGKDKPLTVEEMTSVCNTVVEIAGIVGTYKKAFLAREASTKKLTDFAKKQISDAKDNEANKNVKAVKANAELALAIWAKVGQAERTVCSFAVSKSNALLNAVSASMGAFGKAEAAADTAAA